MNGNDLAYPVKHSYGEEFFITGGLTKRELIAAMEMQGLLSDPNVCMDFDAVSAMAVRAADALIKRLSADSVAEGVNLLPMHSRELDEGLTDDQDRGVSR
jgi:hypothetical protein